MSPDPGFNNDWFKWFSDIVEKANLENRTLIHIDYPMPEGLPPVDTSIWLDR